MAMKTLSALYQEIAKREGKLKEVSIGNIREIVGILSDLIYEDSLDCTTRSRSSGGLYTKLLYNGTKRAKRKKK